MLLKQQRKNILEKRREKKILTSAPPLVHVLFFGLPYPAVLSRHRNWPQISCKQGKENQWNFGRLGMAGWRVSAVN